MNNSLALEKWFSEYINSKGHHRPFTKICTLENNLLYDNEVVGFLRSGHIYLVPTLF